MFNSFSPTISNLDLLKFGPVYKNNTVFMPLKIKQAKQTNFEDGKEKLWTLDQTDDFNFSMLLQFDLKKSVNQLNQIDEQAVKDSKNTTAYRKQKSQAETLSTFHPRRRTNSIYGDKMVNAEYEDFQYVDQINPIRDEMEIIKLIMLNFSDKCKRFYVKS